MLDKAKALQDTMTRIRRTIHMNPELGFEEFETAALVSDTLTELGVEHQTGVGKTGIVARLGDGNGPAIGIRADMDALPILEANDVPYKSRLAGKMHACGHDAHTAMLLGVAMLLKDEPIDGEVRLLFQPSEERSDAEGVSGAPRMIADGAIEGLDAVIALHVDSTRESGQVTVTPGHITANSDRVVARIIGYGGHGAHPHLAVDPIFMLGPILSALHGIVSRRVDPIAPAVITVGKVQGGTVDNVIPNEVELELTLRSLSEEVRELLINEVENTLSIARTMGGDYIIAVQRGYPTLYNDPTVTAWVRETAQALIGEARVVQEPPSMGGEDFSYMAAGSRGMMFMLGAAMPTGPTRYHHHPEFDIDEAAMPIGAAILAQTALRFGRGELK